MKTFLKSFFYAFNGIRFACQERNMRIHIIVLILVCFAGFFFQISTLEWIACMGCFGLVLSLETINSAIENMVDNISKEMDPKYGKIKDISAGAVLIAAIFTAIIGCIIFIPKLFMTIQNL